MNPTLKSKLQQIKMMVMDVDGTLTNGDIHFGEQGELFKTFSVYDGYGINLLHEAGINTAIITGRVSTALTLRAKQLSISKVIQGRNDKWVALQELAQSCHLSMGDILYIGDDLPDLPAIKQAGVGVAVSNAHTLVRKAADWVTQLSGGKGAVREVCEHILIAQNRFEPMTTLHMEGNNHG